VSERARPSIPIRWVAPVLAAALVALVLIAVSAMYPLPIVIGAQPRPLIAAFALAAALLVVALLAEPESRTPRVGMSGRELGGLLAWWVGAFLVAALLAYASWKAWYVVALVVAIALFVKVLQVASHFELRVGFGVWMPFAGIMLFFAFLVVIGQFLGRTTMPPPLESALAAYGPDPPALASPTRPAPDLSAINASLQRSGDITMGGLQTTAFTYEFRGSGVDVYLADVGFPAPRGSEGADDPPGWWVEVDGTALRTGPKGTNFLVVAWEPDVADQFAAALADDLHPSP
jgi:hypothetical protein